MNIVSFSGRAGAVALEAVPIADGHGVIIGARQGRLSGRPSCRIYPLGKGWGLELERASAWLTGWALPGGFRFFRSLSAAVAFAEAHDLDYRIIRPTPLFSAHRRRRGDGARLRRTGASTQS